MKTPWIALLTCLLAPLGAHMRLQDEQEQQDEQEEQTSPKKPVPGVRARVKVSDVLTEAVEGCWMLFDYTDPSDVAMATDAANGFATFQDGFMTLMLSMATVEARLFNQREFLALDAGAYRFRFDEQGMLQLSSVLSFTNQTDTGDVVRERDGQAMEYYAQIDDGTLVLRDTDGVAFSFRKVEAREFPQSAVRRLEGRRSGTQQWEDPDDQPK